MHGYHCLISDVLINNQDDREMEHQYMFVITPFTKVKTVCILHMVCCQPVECIDGDGPDLIVVELEGLADAGTIREQLAFQVHEIIVPQVTVSRNG